MDILLTILFIAISSMSVGGYAMKLQVKANERRGYKGDKRFKL